MGAWLTDQFWLTQEYGLKHLTIDGVCGSSHRFSSLIYVYIFIYDYNKKIWYFFNFIFIERIMNFHISF